MKRILMILAAVFSLACGAAQTPAPGRFSECTVLSYVQKDPDSAASGASSTGTVRKLLKSVASPSGMLERTWVVRSSSNSNVTYAVKQTVLAATGSQVELCSYTPNRVLVTLEKGESVATFTSRLAAKGLTVKYELMKDADGNAIYVVESSDSEHDVVETMTASIQDVGYGNGKIYHDTIYSICSVPNDPYWSDQWNMEKIGAPEAWDAISDASDVVVGVLDTGINYYNIDLSENLWMNPGEAAKGSNGVDDDGNGIVDDIYGVQCIGGNLNGNPMDDKGHGSHCAGIIGAGGNNNVGVAGVAWKAKIMGLKFCDANGNGGTVDAIRCLNYAEDHGARVINCSWIVKGQWDTPLAQKIEVMGLKGILFVCAAGNANKGEEQVNVDEGPPTYPACFTHSNVIAVAATDANDELAGFSYWGERSVDIAAPGEDVYSTVLGGYGWKLDSGTSMAAPHVTGALALLMAYYPDESSYALVQRLYDCAEPLDSLKGFIRTGKRLSLKGLFGLKPLGGADVTASLGTLQDAVALYWNAVEGATFYSVFRSESEDGEKEMLCDWKAGLTYSDTTAEPGKHYWYFIKAATSAEGAGASPYSVGVQGWRLEPTVPTTVKVNFNAAGGSNPEEQEFELKGNYTDLPVSTKAGSVFLGWFTEAEGGVRIDATCAVREDIQTLYAHWAADNEPRIENLFARQRYPWNGLVDITFGLAGVPEGDSASVSLSVQNGAEALPVRTFVGRGPTNLLNGTQAFVWNSVPDTGSTLFTNLALVASLTIDERKVMPESLAITGVSSVDAGSSVALGCLVSYSDGTSSPVTPIWTLTGGSDYATLSSAGVLEAKPTALARTAIVSASYAENGVEVTASKEIAINMVSVTVSFDGNGGIADVASKSYVAYGPYGSLPSASRTGYSFDGWFTSANGGTQITETTAVPNEAVTLHAHWTANLPPAPTGVAASDGTYSSGVQITWHAVQGATKYAIYRHTTANIIQGTYLSTVSSTSFVDTSALAGVVYYYAVRAYNPTLVQYSDFSEPDSGYWTEGSLSKAVDNEKLDVVTGDDDSWEVDSASAYMGESSAKSGTIGDDQTSWMETEVAGPGAFSFYWKVSSEESYDLLKWSLDGQEQGEISGETDWTKVVKELSAGPHVIRWTYIKDESGSEGKDCGWVDAVVTPLSQPTNVSAGDGVSTDSVKIGWTASAGATSYTIWRGKTSDPSVAIQIGTATTTSYTDMTGEIGVKYYYWVCATDGTRTSAFGTPDMGYRALTAPTTVKASDNSLAVGVCVTWDAVEGADSYTVYRNTSTSSDSATQIGTAMGPAYVDSEIASGTTYYYYVKANHSSGTASVFSNYDKGSRKAGEPLYVVVDLSGGTTAGNYPISELSAVPSGGWTDEYKTNKLVLRRIANGSFMMGSLSGEVGRDGDEDQHQVTISKSFYMGVFEVTQRQYELVTGSRPSYFSNELYYATRPVENVSYNTIRGSVKGAKWPAGNFVDLTSFMGRVRTRTGLIFDLPTEAQWEYACRAGTTTALNNGKNLLNSTGCDSNLNEVGRYWYNFPSGGTSFSASSDLTAGTAKVGSYKPNNWGLYDMHGNVFEWCLDWYATRLGMSAVTDPKGAASGSYRVMRGGCWNLGDFLCRSAYRNRYKDPSYTSIYGLGFRLCCPAGLAMNQVTVSFDANGGTGTMSSVRVGTGASMVVPECTFKRSGYSFVGWMSGSNADNVHAVGVTMPSVTENMTLYAKWTVARQLTKTYVVVDLSAGASATSYPVSELSSVPSGGWSSTYKTAKLVLRRIENGTFSMGSAESVYGRQSGETLHSVTISKAFYVGVFEVTQKQYELVMGSNPSKRTGDARPVENVSYDMIRGNLEGAKWPESDAVDATSFLGKIRDRSGLVFDLPTEAQWEYACRAGTTTAFNNGKNLTEGMFHDPAMDEVGRYGENESDGKGGYSSYHTTVGSYKANNWGIYDMHGNVEEWCRDWSDSVGAAAVTDPIGPQSGWARVYRGGSCIQGANPCRSAFRHYTTPETTIGDCFGFRLSCPAGL